MASIFAVQYRVDSRRLEEVHNAARQTLSLYTRLGAQASLRQTVLGGEEASTRTVLAVFANAADRSTFMDEVIKPENVAENGLLQAAHAADRPVTLLGRSWFQEQPATEALPSTPPVLVVNRVKIQPGRWVDGEAALREYKHIRDEIGQETHIWVSVFAGSSSWTHVLTSAADSFADTYTQGAKVTAYNAERGVLGPFPRALQSGAWEIVSQSMSSLVRL